MSETSTLISCTGTITRAELTKLPTPPATATHLPIPHTAVVETLMETLSHRHIGVSRGGVRCIERRDGDVRRPRPGNQFRGNAVSGELV